MIINTVLFLLHLFKTNTLKTGNGKVKQMSDFYESERSLTLMYTARLPKPSVEAKQCCRIYIHCLKALGLLKYLLLKMSQKAFKLKCQGTKK